jgi:hypothetical protein
VSNVQQGGRAKTGGQITLIGGIVGLIAFFLLPYLSLGVLSYSGVQLAGFASQLGASGDTLLIWLIPVAGLAAAIQGGRMISRASQMQPARGLAIGAAVSGGVGVLVLFLPFVSSSGSAAQIALSFVGFGYWVTLLGLGAALVGGIIALASKE